ncbi:MAG: homocysteine S-methyltransferase family protein [Actinobacteria bacterium]|nr:homocysteine S-methyltransferase family protein [Actinomycetota bacterium]
MLSDGGIETVLIFHDGLDLPAFAAFPLLGSDRGRYRLQRYYRDFVDVAASAGTGFLLETPTWRASADWGAGLGYGPAELTRVAHDAVALGHRLRDTWTGDGPFLVSGCVGPRGDGSVPGLVMSPGDAARYHRVQVGDLAAAGADLVTATTLGDVDEATGFVMAAVEHGVPAVVGFTVETDGRLPSGAPLGEAVEEVDAATDGAAAWFMVNCAHPDHVLPGLPERPESWAARVRAYRPNASRLSHADLDAAGTLDEGDPAELATGVTQVRGRLPGLRAFGGCCGTDVRHVAALAAALAP